MGAWAGPPGKLPLKDCQILKSYKVFEKVLLYPPLSSLSHGLTRSADAIAISVLKNIILMNLNNTSFSNAIYTPEGP